MLHEQHYGKITCEKRENIIIYMNIYLCICIYIYYIIYIYIYMCISTSSPKLLPYSTDFFPPSKVTNRENFDSLKLMEENLV